MVPEAGIEPARLSAGDFESPASTNFTTRALGDRARGALERSRALYDVIKILRARGVQGSSTLVLRLDQSSVCPALLVKIHRKPPQTPLTVTPCQALIYNLPAMPQR